MIPKEDFLKLYTYFNNSLKYYESDDYFKTICKDPLLSYEGKLYVLYDLQQCKFTVYFADYWKAFCSEIIEQFLSDLKKSKLGMEHIDIKNTINELNILQEKVNNLYRDKVDENSLYELSFAHERFRFDLKDILECMVDTVTTVERLVNGFDRGLLSAKVTVLSLGIDRGLGIDLGYTPFEETLFRALKANAEALSHYMHFDEVKNGRNTYPYNVLYQTVSDIESIFNDMYNREKEKELRKEEMREEYFDEEY